MMPVNNITSDASQSQSLIMPDGSQTVLQLLYRPQSQGWFITKISNAPQGLLVKGIRISVNPNILRQFKNLINFGLTCYTTQGREPMLITDFSSGLFTLYVLSAAEVLQVEAELAAQRG